MSRRRLPLVALLVLAGCSAEAETRAGESDDPAVQDRSLPGVEIAQTIQLGGGRDQEHVLPLSTGVSVGQWVEFVTLDRRVHTLSFVADSLTAEAKAYLEVSGQMHSPPLLERGTRFLVDFRDAPPGRYVFSSRSHGAPVFGSITVQGETADR